MKITNEIIKEGQEKMVKAEEALQHELGGIRAGRANASLLNRVTVDYYGAPTPLNQIAQISIPEARVLLISPYDKSSLDDIEHALLASDLGLNPVNDGTVIRLVIPQLTEERRKELAKEVKAVGEKAKGSVRHARRDIREALKKAEKDGEMSEDELKSAEDRIQKLTDKFVEEIDKILANKEKEVMSI